MQNHNNYVIVKRFRIIANGAGLIGNEFKKQ